MHLLKKIFLYSFITIQYFLLYFSIHFKISLIQNCQFYQLNFISDELISFFFFFFSEHFSISFLSTSLFLLSITFEKIVIQSLFSILNDKKKKICKKSSEKRKITIGMGKCSWKRSSNTAYSGRNCKAFAEIQSTIFYGNLKIEACKENPWD